MLYDLAKVKLDKRVDDVASASPQDDKYEKSKILEASAPSTMTLPKRLHGRYQVSAIADNVAAPPRYRDIEQLRRHYFLRGRMATD